MAGEEGFEPSNAGSKDRCLTTWRLPREPSMVPPRSDGAMAVRGYRRRAALVLHRRRTQHRLADRCGHGPSQGDGVSVDVLMATRRSSAVDHGPGRVEGDSEKAESDAPTRVGRHHELRYQRVASKLDVEGSSPISRSTGARGDGRQAVRPDNRGSAMQPGRPSRRSRPQERAEPRTIFDRPWGKSELVSTCDQNKTSGMLTRHGSPPLDASPGC